jgi:hypothetical protein
LINVLTKAASLSHDIKRGAGRKRGRGKFRKNPWFDLECIKARIELRQGCKKYRKTPLDFEIRLSYFTLQKAYRKLIMSHKKKVFHANLNKEIEDGKEIRWENFKKLIAQKCAKEDDIDLYDIVTFYKFFQDLYREKTLPPETVERLKKETDEMQRGYIESEIDEILNNTTSQEELSRCILHKKTQKNAKRDLKMGSSMNFSST